VNQVVNSFRLRFFRLCLSAFDIPQSVERMRVYIRTHISARHI
jgi:hypothetical protein